MMPRCLATRSTVEAVPFPHALSNILDQYWDKSPTSARVVDQLYKQGFGLDQLHHDHLAFRTFGVQGLGIECIGHNLRQFGYTRQEDLTFPAKKLQATWFAPPQHLYEHWPRVFVSELKVHQLSASAQQIIHKYTQHAQLTSPLHAWTCLMTARCPWSPPDETDYDLLLQESEYAAWVLANGFLLNHTALSVHRITSYSGDLQEFAALLVRHGFQLNQEGGVIKASPDKRLLQCSTIADLPQRRLVKGGSSSSYSASAAGTGTGGSPDIVSRAVAGPYMEFVWRLPQPAFAHIPHGELTELQRRDGFEVGNADKIFESTTLAAMGGKS